MANLIRSMQNPNILHIDSIIREWCDKDIVMLHACFQRLTDCIKKENLLTGETNWDYTHEFKNAKKEIEYLYS